MAKIKIKNSVTPGLAPSGLSFGEMAVNIVDKKIFIGNAVEGVVTLHDQNNIVTSINGATGQLGISASTGITIYPNGKTFGIGLATSGVVSGTTGSTSRIPILTIDDYGRITNVTTASVTATVLTNTDVSTTDADYRVSLNSTSTSASLYDTAFTFNPFSNRLSMPSGATLYFSGVGGIRSASDVSGGGKTFTIAPHGDVVISPTTYNIGNNSIPYIIVPKSTQEIIVSGDLYLGTKQTDFLGDPILFPSNIIFEGADDNGFETTLTIEEPTADRTIILPNASTTLAGLGVAQTFILQQQFSAGISASGGITGTSYIFAESGFRVGSSALNSQTDSYSLQSSDNGKIITVNAGTVKSITVPSGLPVGFNCTVIRVGAGRVTFSASGTTINSVDGLLEIASQHGAASLLCYSNNTFNLSGNLA